MSSLVGFFAKSTWLGRLRGRLIGGVWAEPWQGQNNTFKIMDNHIKHCKIANRQFKIEGIGKMYVNPQETCDNQKEIMVDLDPRPGFTHC